MPLTLSLYLSLSLYLPSNVFVFVSIFWRDGLRGDGEICSVAAGGICEKQMGGRGIGEEQDPTHLDQLDQLR